MFENPAFVPPPALSARAPAEGDAAMFANPAFVPPPPIERDLQARATLEDAHFVVYSDAWVPGQTGPPAVSAIKVSTFLSIRLILDCSLGA